MHRALSSPAVASKVMEGTVSSEKTAAVLLGFPCRERYILLGRSAVKPVVTQVEDSALMETQHDKIPS